MSLKLTENLTAEVEQDTNSFFVDRQSAIELVWQILSRERCRFPILIGEYGVGRTTFLNQFAYSQSVSAPAKLKSLVVRRLDVDDLHLHSGRRFSERLINTIESVNAAKVPTFLVFDELDGLYQRHEEAWQVLFRAIRYAMRNDSLYFGLTSTPGLYYREIQTDPAMRAITVPVWLQNPSEGEVKKLLEIKLGDRAVSDSFLDSIIGYAEKFVHFPAMPGGALNLLDGVLAVDKQEPHDEQDIQQTLVTWYGIEESAVAKQGTHRLADLEEELSAQIFGQPQAVQQVARHLPIYLLHLDQTLQMPLFVFYGAPGVGKKTTAKALHQYLYAQQAKLFEFDLTHASKFALMQALASASASHRLGVLLLWHVDKAPVACQSFLFELASTGKFFDSSGRKILCDHMVMVMTMDQAEEIFSPTTLIPSRPIESKPEHPSEGLLQLVVNDMPSALVSTQQSVLPITEPNVSMQFVELTSELNTFATFVPFVPLNTVAKKQLVDKYLLGLQQQCIAARGVALSFMKDFPDHLMQHHALAQLSAQALLRQLKDLLLPVMSQAFLHARGKSTMYEFAIGRGGELSCYSVDQKPSI